MEGEGSGSASGDEEMSYEDSLERLEEIVGRLESGQLPLDESLRLFEEGTRLTKVCQKRLTEAELRIERLMADGDRTEEMPSSGLDG
ncbi:MAG: exodeoxyribonuclease VII small subunit [Thermoplasmata archaeon]|nr:MAG: exodeoxyribonuclease VII small subunit [Thermoplasmata archaeon]